MRFSEFFTAPAMRALSIRAGFLVGLAVILFSNLDWRYGVLIGAGVALVASVLLPFIFYVRLLPYKRIKEKFPRPFLVDAPVRCIGDKKTIGGFFVLTPKSMIFLSRECANTTLELSHGDVESVCLGEDEGTIDIILNQKQFIRVISNVDEEIVAILKENGWNVTE